MDDNVTHYELLTREEAANYLGIAKGTLCVWATKKINIPFVKIGRLVRYKLTDLNEFIERRYNENDITYEGEDD